MRWAAVAGLVVMVGCALNEPITNPSLVGPAPSQWQMEEGIRLYIQSIGFKDPGSVQVRNVRLDGPMKWNNIRGAVTGWQITADLNAKNSFGGYTGFRPHQVLFLQDGSYRWRTFVPEY